MLLYPYTIRDVLHNKKIIIRKISYFKIIKLGNNEDSQNIFNISLVEKL